MPKHYKLAGQSEKDYAKSKESARMGAAKTDQVEAKTKADKENGFNERMGISAGKPVAVSDGLQSKTYLPMKKVEGVPLSKELQKDRTDPSYISSHKLLDNTKQAIFDTNSAGITHNNANVDKVMVTEGKGKMIDYSKAEERRPVTDRLKDQNSMVGSLRKTKVPLDRQDSFNHAVDEYDSQIKLAESRHPPKTN
jgi:tRNA A-37 threonylcarbamoyl transferase component Bud32